jgi:hypothetical protein
VQEISPADAIWAAPRQTFSELRMFQANKAALSNLWASAKIMADIFRSQRMARLQFQFEPMRYGTGV